MVKKMLDFYRRQQGFITAMEVLSGHVDTEPAIRPVAGLSDLDFVPIRWERYDLLFSKEHFFEQGVQLFLGLLHEPEFRDIARKLDGYNLSLCTKMVFSKQLKPKELQIDKKE